jgi:protein-S-isoprenylcysteine O-methyltransferase Ste14
VSLKTKWTNGIYKIATGSRKVRTLLTPIVGLSYILFASFFVIVSFPVDRVMGFPKILHTPLDLIFSAPLLFIGIVLILWSVFLFLKAKGTPVPLNPPPTLVVNGPYAFVRNPMLSGIFFALFGCGILVQSISLICIFTPLFILINIIEIKVIEEPELEMRLGQEYLAYKKKTPMFIPKNIKQPKRNN